MQIAKDSQDYEDLRKAVSLLEASTITERLSQWIGGPIEFALRHLPKGAEKTVNGLVGIALRKATDAALYSLDNKPGKSASTRINKLLAAGSGALGGAFGFAALAVELPVSTTIMLRAVADVARSEGFDLREASVKQSCLEVFALGSGKDGGDPTETAYYTSRAFLTETVNVLSKELAGAAARQATAMSQQLTSTQTGKWLAALIEKVATRLGVVITEKAAAQAVPIIGAVSGAGLNMMFTDFYQDMARGHFIIKRLEFKYGSSVVKSEYELLASKPG